MRVPSAEQKGCDVTQGDAAAGAQVRPGKLIELSNVAKRYAADASPALGGVSLEVAAGEAVAVMGPSGSGKSTLLNMLAGLDKPTSGTVTVAGKRVDVMSETRTARFRRRDVGMIFQFFNLLEDLTVADNILLPAQLARVPRRTARERCGELLEKLGISRYRDSYPGRLSGGERQRVAIARAVVNGLIGEDILVRHLASHSLGFMVALPGSFVHVLNVADLALLVVAGFAIAAIGALGPAIWAAASRTNTALRTE